jgi:hypothetical protein
MSHLQQYTTIIEVYMKPKKKSDFYVLNDYIANIKIESFAVFTSIQGFVDGGSFQLNPLE